MMVGELVLPAVISGMMEASAMRKFCTPITHNWLPTTASGSSRQPLGYVRPGGFAFGAVHPVGARIVDAVQIADRDVDPEIIVASARSDQQHLFGGIRTEAVGEDATGRAGADDDVVVITC